jgi:hypothetical protein
VERLDSSLNRTKKSVEKTNKVIDKLQIVVDSGREVIEQEKNELDEKIEAYQKLRVQFDSITKEIESLEIFFEKDECNISIEALRNLSLLQQSLYSQFKEIKEELAKDQDILITKQNDLIKLFKAQNERQESLLKLKDELTDQLRIQTKQNQKLLKKHRELLKECEILKRKEKYLSMLKNNFSKQMQPGLIIIS